MVDLVNKRKSLGIIGGVSPYSTTQFYLTIIEQYKTLTNGDIPRILIDSLSISKKMEENFIKSGFDDFEYLSLIKNSINFFNDNFCNFIVMPCNSLHKFEDEFTNIIKTEFISITSETTIYAAKKQYKKVGILGVHSTINDKIFELKFNKIGIETILLDSNQQIHFNQIILNVINNKELDSDKILLKKFIDYFIANQCDCIILACTELQFLFKNINVPKDFIDIIDSFDILVNSTLSKLLDK